MSTEHPARPLTPVPRRRISALLLAALFLLAGAREGLGSYACPHHEAGGSGNPTHARALPAPDAQGHGSRPSHSAADETVAESNAGHGEHTAPCTCVGDCHAPAQIVLSGAITLSESASSFHSVPREPHLDAVLPGLPAFFLPPSNGPPVRC